MIFKVNQKLNKKKFAFFASLFFFIFGGVFVLGYEASANETVDAIRNLASLFSDPKNFILLSIGYVLQLLINGIGIFSTMIVDAIVSLAAYNNFVKESSIEKSWVLVRDFCNMFFILILLVIAFATILQIESYNMKKWLPKLLIMAILINFSKSIAGLIIDVSQVFMMTFVSSFGSGGGFVDALGINDYFSMAKSELVYGDTKVDFFSTVVGMMFSLVYLLIATVVLIVVLAVLVMRIVMLWIYVVLSPLAFLLAAFPGGQKYSSRWWDEFIKQVITGPILAFFIWLALIVSNTNPSLSDNGDCFGFAEIFCPGNFIHYIIAIGMLMGGLIITSQAGGAVGGIASKGMGAINKGKSFALNKTGAGVKKVGIGTAKKTGRVGLGLARTVDSSIGAGLGIKGGAFETVGRGVIGVPKSIGNRWKKRRGDVKDNYDDQRDIARATAMATNTKEEREARAAEFSKITKTDKKGNVLTYDEKEKSFVKKDKDTGEITHREKAPKMTEARMRMIESFSRTNSSAVAADKAAEDKEVVEKADELDKSGISEQELHRRVSDRSFSESDRKAAALRLGTKADHLGGMTQEQVKEVRGTLGSNKILQSKFDESMEKKYAHKIYNLDEEDGQKKYIKAARKGKIDDNLDESALRDERVHTLLEKETPAKYERMMKIAKEDKSTADAAKIGLGRAIDSNNFVLDSNGIINPFRKQMVQLTDNLGEALKDVKVEDIPKGVNSIIENMSATQMAKMDVNNFDDKAMLKTFGNDTEKRDKFRGSFNAAIELRIDSKELAQVKRAEGKIVPQLKERLDAKNARNADNNDNNEDKDNSNENTNQIGTDRDD